MILFEDTRQQADKHTEKQEAFAEMGITVKRTKLMFGDYMLETTMPKIAVDTKQDWQEVAGNLVQQHDRFVRECDYANELNAKLYILVEEDCAPEKWANPRLARWCKINNAHKLGRALNVRISKAPPLSGERLAKIVKTFEEHHNVKFVWCSKEQSAELIMQLLQGGIE